MKVIVKSIIDIINRLLTGKKIFFYTPNSNNEFGKTAVKTKFGFWYVGDILDQRDIACGILRYGEVEPEETALTLKIFDYLKHKDRPVVFDIGANTGYYSLLAAHYFENNVEIYSFEPIREYADCIRESARINRFSDSIQVCDYALSNKNSDGQIYVWGTCSSLDKDFNNRTLPSQNIQLKRLDDTALDAAPDFIKIDTEGHELATLEGGINTIKKHKPILFIEIIDRLPMRNYTNKNYQRTIEVLLNLGYEAYLFRNNTLEKITGNETLSDVCMHLFLHPEKHRSLHAHLAPRE